MFADTALLQQLIDIQHRAIRYHLLFAVGLVALGMGVTTVISLSPEPFIPEYFNKNLLAIGGTFVSSLSTFPLKEILNRKDKVNILKTIKACLPELAQAEGKEDEATRRRINDLLWQMLEKAALG